MKNKYDEYFEALERYHKRNQRDILRWFFWIFGGSLVFVGLLMFIFLADFWPWNQ